MLSSKLNNKGINLLHAINGFITFSYAVLFSSLVLYLTRIIGYSKTEANALIGLFLAFNFGLHLIAGYIGGRFISNRMLLLCSCIFQVLGTGVLSLCNPGDLIYGLSLFLIGCGINSTCLKCILTQHLEHDDDKRDMAFFINYAVVNAGFLLGFFAGGYYDLQANYKQLFILCNFFNVLAIILIIIGWKSYGELKKLELKSHLKQINILILILFCLLAGVIIGFHYPFLSNLLVIILGIVTVSFLFFHMRQTPISSEKKTICAFIILTLSSIIFWTLFYMGPMGITYFLKNNIEAKILGIIIPPQWYMNLNAVFVILGSPLIALSFQKLKKYGYDISLSQKFSLAIMLIAASFFILSLGVLNASEFGYISAFWIVLHFLLQALGELLIAPVGFSMVGKLAPPKLQGIMMGLWMMVSGIAASFSHFLCNTLDSIESTDPLISNPNYLAFFNNLAGFTLFMAFILLLFSKKIEALIAKDTLTVPCRI